MSSFFESLRDGFPRVEPGDMSAARRNEVLPIGDILPAVLRRYDLPESAECAAESRCHPVDASSCGTGSFGGRGTTSSLAAIEGVPYY